MDWTRRGAIVVVAAATLMSAFPATAKLSSEERVVHGAIGTPTGQQFEVQSLSTNPTIESVRQSAPGAYAGCVAPAAGVHDTSWVIDDVAPGRVFELTADAGSWNDDFDIAFYRVLAACDGVTPPERLAHRNRAGDERAVVPERATIAVVILVTGSPGAAFTYRELAESKVRLPHPGKRRPTVVAVVEPAAAVNGSPSGLSPYHVDFLGDRHPWNTDEDDDNDIDFTTDPAGWIPGYPADALPVQLGLPAEPGALVSTLAQNDKAKWDGMKSSTTTVHNLYRLPGTKVVGAIRFGDDATSAGSVYQPNEAHGTKSASVAVGNVYGTCSECVLVFVLFDSNRKAALEWVASQHWIDVVTNSWSSTARADGPTAFPADVIRPAVERGQTWVWSAGNGYDTAFVVPNSTHTWGLHGADWNVTVGAVNGPDDRQTGSGVPVDIASYGSNYRSAGGLRADGESRHNGTSNAAPVVAGTLAKVIQLGRRLLGDATTVPHDGIVAEGDPRLCAATAGCPLQDGLTRAEVQAVVFENVLPAPSRAPEAPAETYPLSVVGQYKTTPSAVPSVSQGHGIVHGRLDEPAFVAEQRRFLDALRGAARPFVRPPSERNWMTADSKCRQRLWGQWHEGYYTGVEPDFDPRVDQAAMAWDAACTPLSTGVLARDVEVVDEVCVPAYYPPACVVWPTG